MGYGVGVYLKEIFVGDEAVVKVTPFDTADERGDSGSRGCELTAPPTCCFNASFIIVGENDYFPVLKQGQGFR